MLLLHTPCRGIALRGSLPRLDAAPHDIAEGAHAGLEVLVELGGAHRVPQLAALAGVRLDGRAQPVDLGLRGGGAAKWLPLRAGGRRETWRVSQGAEHRGWAGGRHGADSHQ